MRFIIVSVPPEPMAHDLSKLQESFAKLTSAAEALRYPPHVTLRTGILCPDDAVETTVQAFLDHAGSLKTALIQATVPVASSYRDATGVERGFLGYQVELSPELLALHQGLLKFYRWQKGPQGVYDPHISLCYHDITPVTAHALLDEYHAELEPLKPAWEAASVELWASVGKSWNFHARATLL